MTWRDWGIMRWLCAVIFVGLIALLMAATRGLGAWSSAESAPVSTAVPMPSAAAFTNPVLADPNAIAATSLFSRNRSADVQSFGGKAESESNAQGAQDWVLVSMLITPSLTMAVFNGSDQQAIRVKLGDTVAGSAWRFSQAEPRAAILTGPGGERRLELRIDPGRAALPNVGGNAQTETPIQQMQQRLEQQRSSLPSATNTGFNSP